jgi:tRNA/tmRNA/rRNA uracil-C5-methylase (TrmA/RlmC/RlmD family)
MPPRKTKDIKAALANKGFVQENRDHSFLFLFVEGRKSSIRTKISHGSKEYGDNLLSLVARQLHLSNKELDDLIDCPLCHEDYVGILKQKQKLQP